MRLNSVPKLWQDRHDLSLDPHTEDTRYQNRMDEYLARRSSHEGRMIHDVNEHVRTATLNRQEHKRSGPGQTCDKGTSYPPLCLDALSVGNGSYWIKHPDIGSKVYKSGEVF